MVAHHPPPSRQWRPACRRVSRATRECRVISAGGYVCLCSRGQREQAKKSEHTGALIDESKLWHVLFRVFLFDFLVQSLARHSPLHISFTLPFRLVHYPSRFIPVFCVVCHACSSSARARIVSAASKRGHAVESLLQLAVAVRSPVQLFHCATAPSMWVKNAAKSANLVQLAYFSELLHIACTERTKRKRVDERIACKTQNLKTVESCDRMRQRVDSIARKIQDSQVCQFDNRVRNRSNVIS